MQEAAIKDDYISELRAEGDAIEAELATCIQELDEVWEVLQEELKRGHALEKTLRCRTTLPRCCIAPAEDSFGRCFISIAAPFFVHHSY